MTKLMDHDARAESIIADLLAEYLAPPPRMTVTEWAEKNRVLSAKDSAEPGPYRVARTPYAIEPQDALSPYSQVEEVVLMWGAQTSKTTVGSNWVGSVIDMQPGPLMIVQPTIDTAKRFSRQRLTPMIEESPALKRKVSENRSRDDSNTILLKEYAGGFMVVAGANSAAGLRSMPIRDIFFDEIDAYPLDVDGEGDPISLAEARQSTFSRRKRLKTSTPTLKGMSRIESAFMETDQRFYHIACPHCGELQALEWGADKPYGLKWQKDQDGTPLPDTAHYVCRHHGCIIEEHSKTEFLRCVELGGQARWVPTNPVGNPRKRGYHLSSLYSPLGFLSWRELVEEWHHANELAAFGDTSELRAFINTRLAETWEDSGDRVAEHELTRRVEDYALGTAPFGCLALSAGIDVQPDRLHLLVWGWGRGEEAWLIDRRVISGSPEEQATWDALDEILRAPIPHASGSHLMIGAAAVDSGGHNTQAVYNYARARMHRHVLAIKGSSQPNRPILGKPSDIEVNHRGVKIKSGAKLWPIGTDTAKALIYGRLRLPPPGAGCFHFPAGVPGEFFEQLTAERMVTKYIKGHPRHEWVKQVGRRNEDLDCFDDQTELLTTDGWKHFADLSLADLVATVNLDTDLIEYQHPVALIDREYSGDLLVVEGKRLNFAVTPTHRMVTYKKEFDRQSRKWNFDVPPKITLAQDLTIHHTIKINAKWEGMQPDTNIIIPASISTQGHQISSARSIPAIDLAAFLGWYVAEGWARQVNGSSIMRRVGLSQTKAEGRAEIERVLNRLPWAWHWSKNDAVITSKQLFDYVQSVCPGKQHERRVPVWIKNSSPAVIGAFVDAAIAGDGWVQGGYRSYATVSKLLADDMAELFIKIGGSPSITERQPKPYNIRRRQGDNVRCQYHVRENNGCRSAALDGAGHQFMVRRQPYSGRVYCATVPNGTLIVRRKGKMMIAGNCTVYAYAAALYLGINRWRQAEWDKIEAKIQPQVRDLFSQQIQAPAQPAARTEQPKQPATDHGEQPLVMVPPSKPGSRRAPVRSGYLR